MAISAGNFHCLALDKDGYVWAWGDNQYGQLGIGEPASPYYCDLPVKVKKDASNFLDNIVYIDAGFYHSMAIDKYGNFWAWGQARERNTHSRFSKVRLRVTLEMDSCNYGPCLIRSLGA